MPEINATKADLMKAIRAQCNECLTDSVPRLCENMSCPLWPYRIKSKKEADQMHLFRVCDKEDFISIVVNAANKFGVEPFYWSELRALCNCKPLNDNWWGISTKRLKALGFSIVDGIQRSRYAERRGGIDRRWKLSR